MYNGKKGSFVAYVPDGDSPKVGDVFVVTKVHNDFDNDSKVRTNVCEIESIPTSIQTSVAKNTYEKLVELSKFLGVTEQEVVEMLILKKWDDIFLGMVRGWLR